MGPDVVHRRRNVDTRKDTGAVCTQRRPCEDTAGRRPSLRPGQRPREKLDLPALSSWTFSLRNQEKHIPVGPGPSLWQLVLATWPKETCPSPRFPSFHFCISGDSQEHTACYSRTDYSSKHFT